MRILHVHSGNLYGGVETFLLSLARYRTACPQMQPSFALCFEGRISGELRSEGVPLEILGDVRVRKPWTVWKARQRLTRFLGAERFDAVVCHSVWSQAIFGPAVRRTFLPLVFWLHDSASGYHWLKRWASSTPPDLAVCNSRFTAQQLPALYRSTRHGVVYCPVLISPATDEERHQARVQLGAPDSATILIQTSRLEEWKGHRLLLAALHKLRRRTDWLCWIVGGAQRPKEKLYLNELRREVQDFGLSERVQFLGQRSDVPRLLAAADIHCQPNVAPEPFGLAFVEALQAGLPVVTTAIGGALEIVDSSCGALVPPHDANALATALERLIEEPRVRRQMSDAGRRRGRDLFAPKVQMSRMFELLEQAVHG
jgi:glycosyltransferase involved in cell wall biosynthesis